MKITKLKKVPEESFDNIYSQINLKNTGTWEHIFKDTIENFRSFSFSKSFWYIGDFSTTKVVAAGGDIELCTPLSKKDWLGLHVTEIGQLFHPMDLPKMRAFTVFMAQYLAGMTPRKRENTKISMLFRMLNADKKYAWCVIHYPKLIYDKKTPKYVFCMISDYGHILAEPTCTMYISDISKKDYTLFYCDDEKLELKPYKPEKELSNRETELIRLLAKGLISKEIAEVLKISKNTVENHKQNIFTKTGTRNLAELVAYAHTNGLGN